MHPAGLSTWTRSLQSLSRSSRSLSWKPTGKPQQTLASSTSLSGTGLHSGASTTARLFPAMAGEGRYFLSGGERLRIPATIDHVVESPLCTTLCRGGARVRTVEHLLSALEAAGVDNCQIEIDGGDEVPLLDGSAKEWVAYIEQVGLCAAEDSSGNILEKMIPVLHEPIYVPAIRCQWFSFFLDAFTYSKEIGSARTFCIFEEVERMRSANLIQGGSEGNAIICSATAGWLNPPLRFDNEPCRHKVLDLIGDFSLFAQNGNQGLLLAHVIAYKAGHSLHAEFVRRLSNLC